MSGGAKTIAYVGLGSNLGDRRAAIAEAVRRLGDVPGVEILRLSELRETAPEGPVAQGPFLNGVVEIGVRGSARFLLQTCLDIEREMGRDRRTGPRWGPRTIDLDVLLFGDAVIDEPGLVVPHPRLGDRRFVLDPLCDLAPDLVHPVAGCAVRDLRNRLAPAMNRE